MSNFQLVHFNEKGSNYINGSTKHRESKEYSKHGFNPLCVLRGKIAAHPYLCVGALTVYPKKTHTHRQNWLLQGNIYAKTASRQFRGRKSSISSTFLQGHTDLLLSL